jgi:hypothetical protein
MKDLDYDALGQIYCQLPFDEQGILTKKCQRRTLPDIQKLMLMMTNFTFIHFDNKEMTSLLLNIFFRFMDKKDLISETWVDLFSFLIVLSNKPEKKLCDLFKGNCFRIIQIDFLLRWLLCFKKYQEFGFLCSQIENKHVQGIKYTKQRSFKY